jgi:hypothetical protein
MKLERNQIECEKTEEDGDLMAIGSYKSQMMLENNICIQAQ